MDKIRYTNLKEKHNDCIILENEGCFLTSWFDDAKLVAEVLHLTVTTVGADRAICAFPIGALDSYLPKLIRSGCKVVIVYMIQIFNGKAMAQIEQPCAFKGIRLIVDRQKRKLVVYVPFKGNVIQYDSIGLSVNDWMVCTPYEECSMVATGLNIPYTYGDRPFFDDALHKLCDMLVKRYDLNVA